MANARPAIDARVPRPELVILAAAPLGLTLEQKRNVQAVFVRREKLTKELEPRYLKAEADLKDMFHNRKSDVKTIRELVRVSENLRAEIRVVYFTAISETGNILTETLVSEFKGKSEVALREMLSQTMKLLEK